MLKGYTMAKSKKRAVVQGILSGKYTGLASEGLSLSPSMTVLWLIDPGNVISPL